MNPSTTHYSDLAVKPQLVRDVPLLTFLLSADPRALARVVPAGLSLHPSASADGTMRFPARFWLAHWSSSPAARGYARNASGLEMADGATRLGFRGDRVETSLHLGERTVITARARVGRERLKTSSGHSI